MEIQVPVALLVSRYLSSMQCKLLMGQVEVSPILLVLVEAAALVVVVQRELPGMVDAVDSALAAGMVEQALSVGMVALLLGVETLCLVPPEGMADWAAVAVEQGTQRLPEVWVL